MITLYSHSLSGNVLQMDFSITSRSFSSSSSSATSLSYGTCVLCTLPMMYESNFLNFCLLFSPPIPFFPGGLVTNMLDDRSRGLRSNPSIAGSNVEHLGNTLNPTFHPFPRNVKVRNRARLNGQCCARTLMTKDKLAQAGVLSFNSVGSMPCLYLGK